VEAFLAICSCGVKSETIQTILCGGDGGRNGEPAVELGGWRIRRVFADRKLYIVFPQKQREGERLQM
jgi:hypothetical protein